ncbi:hypothetical protein [Dactylosporangium sp. NPDC049140]|uniref:hypothetical protein n=1 Tax=Dactylosporangium sp. NPDC049140 TaxID=3155647 RepID=UPI0033DD73FD
MNDVKYLCEQLLDGAPPPLREGAEVLAVARRSTARRSAVRTTGGLVAVAAVTGTAVLVAPALANDHRATNVQVGGPPAPVSPSPSSVPSPPDVPYAQAPGTHEKTMLETIQRALPPGYTAAPEYPLSTNPTPYPTDPQAAAPGGGVALTANVSVLVSQDGRVGWLSAHIYNDGKPLPTGDLCGPDVTRPIGDQPGWSCRVVDVNGTKIRVTREHWTNTAPEIDVITVTKFLRNGALSLTESRSVPDFQSEKQTPPPDAVNAHPQQQAPTSALGDWFLTEDQLAALIADPAMLP